MTSRLVALVVVLGLLAAPVAVAAQSAGKARRIGFVRSLTIPPIGAGPLGPGDPVIAGRRSPEPLYGAISSPRRTVTALPPSFTRSPTTRTRTTPPRGEAW